MVATYALFADGRLIRRSCDSGSIVDVELAQHLSNADATCRPEHACTGDPQAVVLTFTGSGDRNPTSMSLTATLRHQTQASPDSTTATAIPLLVLGGSPPSACPDLQLDGTGALRIIGGAIIADTCGPSPVGGFLTKVAASDGLQILQGVTDPLTAEAPSTSCPASGGNPEPVGLSPRSDAVVVYPQAVVIAASTVFQPGHHVFCAGITILAGAFVSGSDVLLDVADGAFTVEPGAVLDLSAASSDSHLGVVLLVTSGQPVSISTIGYPSVLRGIVYAPRSSLIVTANAPLAIGGIVAQHAAFDGSAVTRLGSPTSSIRITPTLPGVGEVGVAYPLTGMDTSGGSAPFTWSASPMPGGLVMNAIGSISGTPTVAGTFSIVVTVVDATGAAGYTSYTLTVLPTVTLATPVIGQLEVGVVMPDASNIAANGLPPYTWSSVGLPPGLSLGAGGVLGGKPSLAGTYTVRVSVTDAIGGLVSRDLVVTVAPAVSVLVPAVLPAVSLGADYPSTTITAVGGVAPYRFAASGLPAGLAISVDGVIAGRPTTSGSFGISVTVIDALGGMAAAPTRIDVLGSDPLVIQGPATLVDGQAAVDYRATALSASGGASPYRWTATGVPAGLTFSTGGTLSGTPTTAGTYTLKVTVVDAVSATSSQTYRLVIRQALTITGPVTLPSGALDATYAATFTTAGGTAPVSWSATGLPVGLTINGGGVLAGTPAMAGVFAVTVSATDSAGGVATASRQLTIKSSGGCTPGASGWIGEYYKNMELNGSPVMCRIDAAINFSWGSGGPDKSTGTNSFSARWTRTQYFPQGQYDFTKTSDDGFRFSIDGVIMLNDWSDQAIAGSSKVRTVTLAEGFHSVVVEYYEHGGDAAVTFSWDATTPATCPTSFAAWKGEYFDGFGFTGAMLWCRNDTTVVFNWGTNAPVYRMGEDDFSVRWTRPNVFSAGTYRFTLIVDDGARVYIDGVLVLDKWTDRSSAQTYTLDVKLTVGSHNLMVEYYERKGSACVSFTWVKI